MVGGKGWKAEELDYLQDNWGTVSITGIAKHLGRSVSSIKNKAVRLKLGRHIHSGVLLTLNQLRKAFGKNITYTIKHRWIPAGLPVRYQKSITQRFAMIDIDEFWDWAKGNRDLVDFSSLPEGTLGCEPDWVKEARRMNYAERRKTSPWTVDVERRIRDLKITGKPVRREDKPWSED